MKPILVMSFILGTVFNNPLLASEQSQTVRDTKTIKVLSPIKSNFSSKLYKTPLPSTGIKPKVGNSGKVKKSKNMFELLGGGSTGGGQGKDGFLRDLEEDAPEINCLGTMEEFASDMFTFQRIVSEIEAVNAGFAKEIKDELKQITVCTVPGELSSTIVPEQDGVVISQTEYDQLAIRAALFDEEGHYEGAHVYLSLEGFNEMQTEVHQSFLLFHELLHSFVNPSPQVSYINRLRAITNKTHAQLSNDQKLTVEFLNYINGNYRMIRYKTPTQYFTEYAYQKPSPKLVKALVPQVNISSEQGQTLFRDLMENFIFNEAMFDGLIEVGIDIHSSFEIEGLEGTFFSPVEIAIESGDFKAMSYFFAKDVKLSQNEEYLFIQEVVKAYGISQEMVDAIKGISTLTTLSNKQKSYILNHTKNNTRFTSNKNLHQQFQSLLK